MGKRKYNKRLRRHDRGERKQTQTTPEEFRILQRIQNRIYENEQLAKEIKLSKLVVQSTGLDLEKCQWALQECGIPYTLEHYVVHPKYPGVVKGVHLITFVLEDGPLTLKFDIIFKPSNGKFLSYGYRLFESTGNS